MSFRPLIIAEAANPEWTSVPLVGWSLAHALLRSTEGHLVTHVRNRAALLRRGLIEGEDFTAIDNESLAKPAWSLTAFAMKYLKLGYTFSQVTAVAPYLYFEHLVWKTFEESLRAGKWSLVHRITPLSPTTPSLLPTRLKALQVPFLLGPLNGGVPWPPGFEEVRNREGDWLSAIRNAYKLLPYYEKTRRDSSAILAGSRFTLSELPEPAKQKAFFIPENAIDPDRFPIRPKDNFARPLRAVFLGRLVPYKGADIVIEAGAELLKSGAMKLDIIGQGPEEQKLRALADQLGVSESVTFSGWIKHEELGHHLSSTHVLAFPSIREFGGGVVLEAMASGIVPVVADYAGPAELVTQETGIRVPFSSRADLIEGFRKALFRLADSPEQLSSLSRAGQERVLKHYTWERKAEQIKNVYRFALGESDRPTINFD